MSTSESTFQPWTEESWALFIDSLPLVPEVAEQLGWLDFKLQMRCHTVRQLQMEYQRICNESSYLPGMTRNEGRANPWSSERSSRRQSPSPSLGSNRVRSVSEAARPLGLADFPEAGRAWRPS